MEEDTEHQIANQHCIDLLAALDALQKLLLQNLQFTYGIHESQNKIRDLILHKQTLELQQAHKNPLNRFGKKCFSQTDEDGITIEILRRLNIESGVYAEFGVGDGLENNTLILAALRWKGFWVGGQDLAFSYKPYERFCHIKDWITDENIVAHAQAGLRAIRATALDVISLDLDGNDIYFVETLLAHDFHPSLFIVEYNAKFPPPVKFQIPYDPNHQWAGDDYYGASLASFVELFSNYDYQLVCCNAHSGANAFFVKKTDMRLFPDVPSNVDDIYVAPRYHLYTSHGHRQSPKVVETILFEIPPP